MQIYAFHSRAFRQNPAEKFRFRRANFTDFYGIFHKKTARSTPPGKNKPPRPPPTAFGKNNAIDYKAHVDKTRRPARHLVEIHKRKTLSPLAFFRFALIRASRSQNRPEKHHCSVTWATVRNAIRPDKAVTIAKKRHTSDKIKPPIYKLKYYAKNAINVE